MNHHQSLIGDQYKVDLNFGDSSGNTLQFLDGTDELAPKQSVRLENCKENTK